MGFTPAGKVPVVCPAGIAESLHHHGICHGTALYARYPCIADVGIWICGKVCLAAAGGQGHNNPHDSVFLYGARLSRVVIVRGSVLPKLKPGCAVIVGNLYGDSARPCAVTDNLPRFSYRDSTAGSTATADRGAGHILLQLNPVTNAVSIPCAALRSQGDIACSGRRCNVIQFVKIQVAVGHLLPAYISKCPIVLRIPCEFLYGVLSAGYI